MGVEAATELEGPESRTLDREHVAKVAENALREGLKLLTARQYRPLMPLSITDYELEEALSSMARAVSETA